MSSTVSCQLCGHSSTEPFFDMPPVPTQDGIMCDSRAEAEVFPTGSISLHFCSACSYIGNEGYEAEKISFDAYDFSLDHSPLFMRYIKDLARYLVEAYKIKGKRVVDVGCGDGGFLDIICEAGGNEGIGIDSGFDHSKRTQKQGVNTRFIQDYYSKKYRDLRPDLICCRLVIDLLEDPAALLRIIRENLEDCPESLVFIEVPSANYTFGERVIWNVVYEHRSWFSLTSLSYLMESCGFKILELKPFWNNEFLGVIAQPAPKPKPSSILSARQKENIKGMQQIVQNFHKDFEKLLSRSEQHLKSIKEDGLKTIAWGAGARGVTFLNLFDLRDHIRYIVDINTKRQGKFIPGSSQEIVAPEFILSFQPDLIIITNPTYAQEIIDHVRYLGLEPDFWVL